MRALLITFILFPVNLVNAIAKNDYNWTIYSKRVRVYETSSYLKPHPPHIIVPFTLSIFG